MGLLAGGGLGWWWASRSSEQRRRDVERVAQRLRQEPAVQQLREAATKAVPGMGRRSTTTGGGGSGSVG